MINQPKILKLLICCLCFLISFPVFSQDLSGEWQGYYTVDPPYNLNNHKTSIALIIKREENDSYTIVSYTPLKTSEGKDTMLVCQVSFKRINKNTIQLVEHGVEKSAFGGDGYQKMRLKFRTKNDIAELYGRWRYANDPTPREGKINFTRSK